jgi:predicted acyl esterase
MTIKTVKKFPHKIKEVENFWIPLSDGVKLAARMWIPLDAEKNPVPAVLEYLPYRKRDGTIVRHHWRMRGNGDT